MSWDLQWRPGLLPRLTCRNETTGSTVCVPAMEAGTIAPADTHPIAFVL